MKKILWITALLATTLCAQKIDPVTGLIVDRGLDDIKEHCTVCHPGRFMVVNGGDRNFWQYKVDLMKKGFGLWEVEKESLNRMLDYLSKNYSKKVNVSVNE
jgi:hypothetical protein